MIETKTAESHAGLTPLEANLLDNFYWSFHHSQGDPPTQRFINQYLALHYQSVDRSLFEELRHSLFHKIVKMKFPRQHTKIIDFGEGGTFLSPERVRNEFESSWTTYIDMLENPTTQNGAGLLVRITNNIIRRDIRFQAAEREMRLEGADPHESFVLTYAYKQTPTNSPEFDRMYQDVRQLLDGIGLTSLAEGVKFTNTELIRRREELGLNGEDIEDLVRNIKFLLQGWKGNHKGQSFVPQAIPAV